MGRAQTPGRERWGHVQRLLHNAAVPSPERLKAHWRKVGAKALSYLARRPLTLVRHEQNRVFFHTGPLPPLAKHVHSIAFEKREGGEGVRVWIDSIAGLLGLVDMDVIEVHPWNATIDDIEHPDQMIFDLDPGDGVPWPFVIQTALVMREFLTKGEGLKCWPKATGGKGLHIIVPLDGSRPHDAVRSQAHGLAERFASLDERLTVVSALSHRPGRIFIDYLRNGRGQTGIGAWSPRARPGFPIARPLTWEQVKRGVRSDAVLLGGE